MGPIDSLCRSMDFSLVILDAWQASENSEASTKRLRVECSDEQRALVSLINALEGKFPACSRAQVEDAVCEEYAAFNSGPVRTMVPLFVEHAAVKRLRASLL